LLSSELIQDTIDFFSQPTLPASQIKLSKTSLTNQLFSPERYHSTNLQSNNFYALLAPEDPIYANKMKIDGESTSSQDGLNH
jgi:hypothetical protein